MATFISHSPEETAALGECWGREAKPGWLVGLTGALGAGKTHLVKGIALGLGITTTIRSPSFTLIHEYHEGRLPLAHLDWYRLETPAQIVRAGLEPDLLQPQGLTVVEWIERWPDFVEQCATRLGPRRFRHVSIELLGERDRRIDYEDLGG